MRIVLNLALLALIGVLGVVVVDRHFFPCLRPLTYEIDRVDAEFDMSREELREIAMSAEELWEEDYDKDLFSYEPNNAQVEISLVYDERQQETNEAREFETTLDSQQGEIDTLEDRYEALTQEYEEAEEQFLATVDEYNARMREFEQSVQDWNASERTDEEELAALQEEEQALESMQDRIQSEEEELEEISSRVEDVLTQRNDIASEYNENVETYNDRYTGRHTFGQGEYSSSDTEITIYQYDSEDDLMLVLAHEFGHARGIDHVEDSEAVMHYLMREQPTDPIRLAEQDTSALERVCRL